MPDFDLTDFDLPIGGELWVDSLGAIANPIDHPRSLANLHGF